MASAEGCQTSDEEEEEGKRNAPERESQLTNYNYS